jgi:hypothetical protein
MRGDAACYVLGGDAGYGIRSSEGMWDERGSNASIAKYRRRGISPVPEGLG